MGLIVAVAGPFRHDAGGLRQAARELLSQPPFTTEAPGPVTDVLLRVRAFVAAALEVLLATLVGNTALAWLVVALVTALGVAVLGRWSSQLGREPTRAAAPTAVVRSAAEWYADAETERSGGRWDAAVRAAYAGLVAELVDQGLLDDVRGLTVGEIDRAVAGRAPARAAAVAAAGRAFEDAWYGHRAADAVTYDTVRSAGTTSTASRR